MAYDDIRWSGPNALGAGDMPAVITQAPLLSPRWRPYSFIRDDWQAEGRNADAP